MTRAQDGSGPFDLPLELLGLVLGLERWRAHHLANALLDAALGLVKRAACLALGLADVLLGRTFGLEAIVAGQLAETLLDPANHLVLASSHRSHLQTRRARSLVHRRTARPLFAAYCKKAGCVPRTSGQQAVESA